MTKKKEQDILSQKTIAIRTIKEDNLIEKKAKKKTWLIGIPLSIILLIVIPLSYIFLCPKFQDVTIELGNDKPELQDFIKNKKLVKTSKVKLLTNIEELDYSKTNTYNIELSYNKRKEKVKLNIVDTTPPELETKNISKYIDFEFKEEDIQEFVNKVEDKSPTNISIEEIPEINGFGEYEVILTATDTSGNKTSQPAKLTITRIVTDFTLEYGEKLTKKDILLNYKNDKNAISQSDINEINKKKVGDYTISVITDDFKEKTTIHIVDTTAPNLKLKKTTIYEGDKVSSEKIFIKSVYDKSKYTTKLNTEIDYSKIGSKQDIEIEAEDEYGNKTIATTTLTIKKDTDPPVLKGLTDLSVKKNTKIDYKKGVTAYDLKDGNVDFTYDDKNVKLNEAGTYIVKYTAKDKKGNTTTKTRKVTIKHDKTDTDRLFNEFYDNYLAGKSVEEMTSIIKSKIRYNSSWGEDDPVWYGLTNNRGNCYVHALILKKALDKKGIKNMLINTSDKYHYWNLVYTNGVWRHYDSTTGRKEPTLGLTDEEKQTYLEGHPWSESFPKAE